MKILHILDHSLPLHSGYSFRSENIISCQQQIGLNTAVVTSPKHEAFSKETHSTSETINNITYYRTGVMQSDSPPLLAEWRLIKKLKNKIIETSRKEKPDILHAHSPVLNAYAALGAAKKLSLPVVYEIRAFWEDAAVDHGTCKEWGAKYRLIRKLETNACKKSSKVLTICDGLKNELIQRNISPDHIGIIPNAIAPDKFKPVSHTKEDKTKWGLDGAFVMGFIGSFYHYEGLDLLLEAVVKLKRTLSDIKILLVGGGPMEDQLKQQAKKLQINDCIVFTGRLPHDEIPVMYSLLDILILPRKSMRLTELVTPLKPLESMCMGKLVVASDVGGHKELIRDRETGYLFKAGDVDALVEKIEEIYKSRDTWPLLTDKAFQWVTTERLWANNALKYKKLYESLL